MNIKVYVLVLCLAMTGYVSAQDLRDLRAMPDTNFVETQERPLGIKGINVPIPRLDLSVDYWKHWTKLGLNLNQASFSDNWSAGGVNSVAWSSTAWHKSEYNRGDFNFATEVDLRYGKIRNKDQAARKNNDRIFWDNKLSYKLSNSWALYTSVTFESQFDIGPEYSRTVQDSVIGRKSNFMAPGYFTESFGLEYKPDKTLSVRFGTGTARQTIILDDRLLTADDGSRFGVEAGKRIRNDLAFQLTANLDRDITKDFNVKARYNLFADYQEIGNPDHRLDLTLTARVTRVISVTVNGIMVYDRNFLIDDRPAGVQYSQALALGLLFSFPR